MEKSEGIKKLEKKLDAVFSVFIRTRDADENGNCTCPTCGRIKHWKFVDCGHYIKRQHMATRYNEMNCHAQCKRCNGFEQGVDVKYRAALVRMYGEDKVLALEWEGKQTKKYTRFELQILIDHYTEKICQNNN